MRIISSLLAVSLALSVCACACDNQVTDMTLQQAVENPARSPDFVARDSSRHPLQELQYFGIKPNMTVVEIWPSKGYWTEILTPYLRNHGTYYVAVPPGEVNKSLNALLTDKRTYGNVKVIQFGKDTGELAPAGSVDAIVTFRNLHNWMKMGFADNAISRFYKALKAGGVLGIEDHRGLSNIPQSAETADGYVQEKFAIRMMLKAGFEYVGSSPMNNNPKDTKRWPKGVWTLPPTLALGDRDKEKYEAVGEADNFVLLFRKPSAE